MLLRQKHFVGWATARFSADRVGKIAPRRCPRWQTTTRDFAHPTKFLTQ